MAQPIPTDKYTDKVHTQSAEKAPKWEAPAGVDPCVLLGESALVESWKARVRRETATVILAGFAGASRGGGLDQMTDSALEWADLLLEKLSR